jgi:threonine/homoserine/homoserine lactone efflux protein
MDLSFLVRGFAIGFTVALGVGPITLLTIRRTLAHGRVYGLASGLGVATADASYGGIAAFGLTAITALLVGARAVLGLVGGVFLLWLGIRTLLAPPPDHAASVHERPGLVGAALSIYGLTMTNPMTILSFGAIFVGLGLAGRTAGEAALLTAGVWLGSMAWWIILTTLLGAFRTRLTPRLLLAITRVSGIALLLFGALALAVAAGLA